MKFAELQEAFRLMYTPERINHYRWRLSAERNTNEETRMEKFTEGERVRILCERPMVAPLHTGQVVIIASAIGEDYDGEPTIDVKEDDGDVWTVKVSQVERIDKTVATPAMVPAIGSQWRIRDAEAAKRARLSFNELGALACEVVAVAKSGVVSRRWPNSLPGSSPTVEEFLRDFVPADQALAAGRFPPQAGDVWRTTTKFTNAVYEWEMNGEKLGDYWKTRRVGNPGSFVVGWSDANFFDGNLAFVRYGSDPTITPATDPIPADLAGWWQWQRTSEGRSVGEIVEVVSYSAAKAEVIVRSADGRETRHGTYLRGPAMKLPAPPAPVIVEDTYETRQAAHVKRTNTLVRKLRLAAGAPECVTCHNAVERVGKSGMCPECYVASRRGGDFQVNKMNIPLRVPAPPSAPFVPSIWASDIPDA